LDKPCHLTSVKPGFTIAKKNSIQSDADYGAYYKNNMGFQQIDLSLGPRTEIKVPKLRSKHALMQYSIRMMLVWSALTGHPARPA
jgi:hypothetical protein